MHPLNAARLPLCTLSLGKPESQLEPSAGNFPSHFQGPRNLPDLIPFRKGGRIPALWAVGAPQDGPVCVSVILRLPWGPAVREEMPHLVFPGRGGDAHGCEQGGTVCVAELGPAPAPVPTPNPLNEIKLALPRGGREAGGGGRKGAGRRQPRAAATGHCHGLALLHLAGHPVCRGTGESWGPLLSPGSLECLGV